MLLLTGCSTLQLPVEYIPCDNVKSFIPNTSITLLDTQHETLDMCGISKWGCARLRKTQADIWVYNSPELKIRNQIINHELEHIYCVR